MAISEEAPETAVSEDATPAVVVAEEAPAMDAAKFLNPAPSPPEPEPAVATASPVAVTTSAPAPAAMPQPEFRLQGIIYTVARPAAIVNGQTVYVGKRVSGAEVVGIYRTHVILRFNGQNKTLVLR